MLPDLTSVLELPDLTDVLEDIAIWWIQNVQPVLTSVLEDIAIWWSQNVQPVLTSVWGDINSWRKKNIKGPMTIAAVIQMVAAVIGFLVLAYQVLKLRNNLEGATQDRLYAHYTEICKLFMQNPELRPYFYGRSSKTVDNKLTPKIAFMCEAILGLVEHAVLQKKNLPGDAWRNCWRPYAIERLEQSEALEKFFEPNAHWYSNRMRKAMKSMKCDLDQKRALAERKRARAERMRHFRTWVRTVIRSAFTPTSRRREFDRLRST
jgi:hypothetical protein